MIVTILRGETMEFQLNVLLNNVDHRTIGVCSNVLYSDKLVIQHCDKYGNPSRTEYVVDRQQAIELANQILKHYNDPSKKTTDALASVVVHNKELPNNED